MVKLYEMVRHEDETGNSGKGRVAIAVEFPDGKCVLKWDGSTNALGVGSLVLYDRFQDMEKVHGHGGKTTFQEKTEKCYEKGPGPFIVRFAPLQAVREKALAIEFPEDPWYVVAERSSPQAALHFLRSYGDQDNPNLVEVRTDLDSPSEFFRGEAARPNWKVLCIARHTAGFEYPA
jgi:hypothetical protein